VDGTIIDWLSANADYLAFGLVSAILLLPRARFVRVLVALFAGVQLARALAAGGAETTIVWMSVLLGAAILLIVADVLSFRATRLSSEEQEMTAALLKGVGRARARHFIDQGFWLNGQAGEVLLREGEPTKHLCFLSAGEARVMMDGRQIGFCRAGDLIGETSLFRGEDASATVVLAGKARFWCAPSERLKPYLDVHGDLQRKIERSIADGAREKLRPDEGVFPDAAAAIPAA
jgi:CRP-like cAMP-binding protein